MPTLLILSHAPHLDPAQAATLELAGDGDGVLLIEDGVYAAGRHPNPLQSALQAARERGADLYALAPDLLARGVETDIPTVDYGGFVDLITRYDRSVH